MSNLKIIIIFIILATVISVLSLVALDWLHQAQAVTTSYTVESY